MSLFDKIVAAVALPGSDETRMETALTRRY